MSYADRQASGVAPLPPEWLALPKLSWQKRLYQLFIQPLIEPIPKERDRLNRERRSLLPERLKTPNQIVGLGHHSCGATYAVYERCNFACTSCYLPGNANATPPLAAPEVRRQLDALRAYLGPQGKAQITAGEVTLLPREVLGSYVAYARKIGLDPMLMTHGERLLEEPDYLLSLVRDYGLMKVGIHVDVTQRGRRGWRADLRETDLHALRDRYAELIRSVRHQTRQRLDAAHTVTLTEKNLDQVGEILSWLSKNLDTFRMISFQPSAEVGRTEDTRSQSLNIDAIWQRIGDALGQNLNRHALLFGHPQCNVVAPLLLWPIDGRFLILESAREGHSWDRGFLHRLTRAYGAFSFIDRHAFNVFLAILSLCARNLGLLLEAPFYGLYRLWGLRSWLPVLVRQLLRGKLGRPRLLVLVVHKFMSSEEINTPMGQERLAACVFKLPVEGKMVSMCEMNATDLRRRLLDSLRGPQRPEAGVRSSAPM